MNKPYSSACDNNRDPILSVIGPLFADYRAVLEVGSGTGQHAVYFAKKLPHLQWYTSDREENHSGIQLWLDEAGLDNVHAPLSLDVMRNAWPDLCVDAVYSANTAHIMHWDEVKKFFAGVGQFLPAQGLFVLYGPFNYDGRYTSESNERFDGWLKSQDKLMGIRDFADLNALAETAGMLFVEDYTMPANNRILCWRKA